MLKLGFGAPVGKSYYVIRKLMPQNLKVFIIQILLVADHRYIQRDY